MDAFKDVQGEVDASVPLIFYSDRKALKKKRKKYI